MLYRPSHVVYTHLHLYSNIPTSPPPREELSPQKEINSLLSLSVIIANYRTLSRTIEHYRELSTIIANYRTLSRTIDHYRELSNIIANYRPLSRTISRTMTKISTQSNTIKGKILNTKGISTSLSIIYREDKHPLNPQSLHPPVTQFFL